MPWLMFEKKDNVQSTAEVGGCCHLQATSYGCGQGRERMGAEQHTSEDWKVQIWAQLNRGKGVSPGSPARGQSGEDSVL